jgi:heme oxygenase
VANYSKYQQNIIKNYYDNKEAIGLQRLSEHVTELYLAEGKSRTKRWKDIVKVLENLKVPKSRIETLVKNDDAAALAKLLEELLAKQK